MRLLVKAGGNVESETDSGLTPLHLASRFGRRKACEFLLDKAPELLDNTDKAGTEKRERHTHTDFFDFTCREIFFFW